MKCTVHIYFQSNYYTDFYTYDVIVLGIYRGRENEKVINGNWTYVFNANGCSNGDFDKAMDEGKTALTNKEYKNALSSFERALDEKKMIQMQKCL